jgi:hypothetical protein
MANTQGIERLGDAKTPSDLELTDKEMADGSVELIDALTFNPRPLVTVVPIDDKGIPTDTEITAGPSRGRRTPNERE